MIKQIDNKQSDIDMMVSPDKWPNWPLLPVKKYTSPGILPECGLLISGHKPIVYICNLFEVKDIKDVINKSSPKIEYKSYEDMVNDGWKVD